MAQFLVVSGLLKEELGEDQARGHLLFTTSQDSGALRQIADATGIPSLPVPENVGGRFSVLSPVGLLPAAVTGIDITELLAGAAEMEERCRSPELLENPAGLIATLLHSAATELGMPIHVMMPYSDRLRSFALWFQQIWAESLGKIREKGDEELHIGPTPLPAVGTTDQHSQLQLFMEGPRDKVVFFVAVEETPDPVAIPELHPEMPGLSYLGGHTLGELLSAERRATTEALRQRGRPSMTLEVEELTAHTLGGLFMLFEVATVFAGALYGVDPLSQPGVELGKELTYGLLGRDGYPAPTLRTGDPRWRV
jgi:glucose-6-phosphate isomerase